MKIPLLDLVAQYNSIKAEVDQAVAAVFATQQFINGPEVRRCEAEIAAYCGVPFATGVSSGTDALMIVLMAEGIGAGDEVITSDYSFFATAGSISRTGAKPVFVDIDPLTFNIDPSQIEAKITPRTRAVIPVHLFGQCADMDPIIEIARRRNLIIIEDAAQAIGAGYKGKSAGSMGDYGCFSFFPSKNLGTAGDGGIVTIGDIGRDEKLKIFRNHGSKEKYLHRFIGGNFRLDTLNAAVVLAKLPHLEKWHLARINNADRYRRLFKEAQLIDSGLLSLPSEIFTRHIYNQFIIRAKRRDELMRYLHKYEIGCEIYYPVPFHLQECFKDLGYRQGEFPESERAAAESLALPIYPELSDDQAGYVVEKIKEFYEQVSP